MWQAADMLVKEVYRVSKHFPKEEIYGLTSQLRRAALSVALNIVEGYSRNSKGDLRRFLDIALGSLAEADYLLYLSQCFGYLSENELTQLEDLRGSTGKLIWSYKSKIEV
jgi:four helix bundle protein